MNHAEYIPAAQVLQHLTHVTLAAIVGPTAAGKSSLIDAALLHEPCMHLVLSHLSRDPRPGEKDGVDAHFDDRAIMERRMAAGEYVQVAPSVFGDLYATEPDDYRTDGVMLCPIIGQAMPAFRALPFKAVRSIFIVPPDYETWQQRIKGHGFTQEQLNRRLVEATHSLIYGLEDETTHLVINDNLDLATEDVIRLALGKSLPARLQADQSRARVIVQSLLERLRDSLR
ncbi:MAG TPA: hypothetical protein VLH38_02770 [Patescibacteria group bacterium]|nr:hypothetical protein [Patescibacteria group bacterium]